MPMRHQSFFQGRGKTLTHPLSQLREFKPRRISTDVAFATSHSLLRGRAETNAFLLTFSCGERRKQRYRKP
jgi:hypothetical protein